MTKEKRPGRFVCIHGHFYQPPRENPWLEAIEVEDSAAPFHNWNARINAECYAANAVARLLDSKGHIEAVLNTYESLSFNFGPTLLSWLEDSDPQTYEAIIEADRRSLKTRSGHGNALAQVYNHMILPLANAKDKETQVRWGIRDFSSRFGRQPEGMWLSETAVDTASLDVLSSHDIRFAVLAPDQAAAVRPLGSKDDWKELSGRIDTSQPYLCQLGDDRSIVLFFYDAPLSRAVAFEGVLGDGAAFTQRILDSFGDDRDHPQLVHLATDGESYGHHHKYGDMALAYTFNALSKVHDVAVTNYGEFLELSPPTMEVKIAERTSWSCTHGVGRWSVDCGCSIAGGSQAWRAPLRETLDWLRDELDGLYETHAGKLFNDPWETRNRYIDVILNRDPGRVDRFLDGHAQRRLEHFARVDALSLLEMERHRMLMFTSCGWFFDDCAGLETVQILKYAARAIQLSGNFGGGRLEQRFIERLKALESNDSHASDGKQIYRARVRPSMVDLRRVVSHHAITKMFSPAEQEQERQLYCYQLKDLDWNVERSGSTVLAVGRVRVQSHITRAIEDVSFGLLHFGGHDFNCSLRGAVSVEGYDTMRDTLLHTFNTQSLTDVVHTFDRYFEGHHFGLSDLFLEGRRAVLKTVTGDVLSQMEDAFETLYEKHRKLFDALRVASFPLPEAFNRTIEFALERRVLNTLERATTKAKTPAPALDRLEELAREVVRQSIQLDQDTIAPPLSAALEAIAEQLLPGWAKHKIISLRRLLKLSKKLGIVPDLWDVQNIVISSMSQRPPKGKASRKELAALFEEIGIVLPPLPRRKRPSRPT